MRILITGSNGEIGSRISKKLQDSNKYEVFTTSFNESVSQKHLSIDLLVPGNPSKLIKHLRPDSLIHLAWHTDSKTYSNSNLNYKWLEASKELLDEFYLVGGSKTLIAGSCAEYLTPQFNCKLSENARTSTSTQIGRAHV